MKAEEWRIDTDASARWIFPEREDGAVNQYVDFLHVFECDSEEEVAELLISADTDFAAWLNGDFIGSGQYSNYPDAKTFERYALTGMIREGRNTLAVTVFYNGRTSSVYQRGAPGLLFEVRSDKVLAASGTETLCRANPCYHSGPIAIVSGQLAFTFGYDARGDDGFQQENYAAGDGWTWVMESESRKPLERVVLQPRPVARLVDRGNTQARLVEAGRFKFDTTLAESGYGAEPEDQAAAGLMLADGTAVSPAWQMQNAQLSAAIAEEIVGSAVVESMLCDCRDGIEVKVEDLDGRDGIYLVFDLGQEEVGHLKLEIDAAEGTVVDIGYGEHLDDGRVRTFVGGRNFAGRYICSGGRQEYCHRFLRWAGRYLQIYIHASTFTLHELALRRCDYPARVRGELDTGNELHGRILDVGCRTLRLCMHEHYEDTPWREQALYANDARIQALCGYYAFGETAMPAASFSLLGHGLRDDGFLNLTAPAKPPLTIPSFTFAWMLAVRDHYLYSGDDSLARVFVQQIRTMLRGFLEEREEGLLPLRQVKGIWHFYDWSAGMSGYSKEEFAQGLNFDAPLNCYLILALEAAAQMLGWLGESGADEWTSAACELREAVADRFWNPEQKVFVTHEYRKRLTELTQALAVLAGVGNEDIRAAVLGRMASDDSGLSGPGLSQSHYVFEALMTKKDIHGSYVLRRIEEMWGIMLDEGATTFWETITGASDFNNAGSLCHGWSAVPVFVFYHDLLGVRPLEPGFRSFAVDPLPEAVKACSGRVPVPGGEIAVKWVADGGKGVRCQVNAPDGLSRVEPAK